MNPILIIILVAILSVAIVVGLAIHFYIKKVRQELVAQGHAVDALLAHRLNLLPYLVETLRKYSLELPEVQKMTILRGELLTDHTLTPDRWQKESVIRDAVNALLDKEKNTPQLIHDLHYLEVKKELQTLSKELEKGLNTYNATVEILHGLARKIPVRAVPSFIGRTQ